MRAAEAEAKRTTPRESRGARRYQAVVAANDNAAGKMAGRQDRGVRECV